MSGGTGGTPPAPSFKPKPIAGYRWPYYYPAGYSWPYYYHSDRPEDASHAAAAAAHNAVRRGRTMTVLSNVQGLRSVEGSNRQGPWGAFHEPGNQQTQSLSGYLSGSGATDIQEAVMPTPQQEIQRLKDELHNTQVQLADYLEPYDRELEWAWGEISDLEDERQRLKEATQSYKDELSVVRRELEDAKNLASIRGKWLQGAEVFLTKTDALSVSEVVEKVTNLNEEIFQAAALLGEALVHERHDVSQEEMDLALGIAQRMIGSKMVNILREQSRKDVPEANPLIVQVALQVFLVTYCSRLVRSWSNDTDCASHLATIYSSLHNQEEQAVAGRWRALTRSHTRYTLDGSKSDLLEKLGCVLRVASWMNSNVEQRDAFERKLDPIFRAVEDLRTALGEKFTSADLEVLAIEPDQVFQPSCMDDAYGDPNKHSSKEIIVGTTGIGLKKFMLECAAKGELMDENMLLPKVALESTLLEALGRSPSKRNRRRKRKKAQETY